MSSDVDVSYYADLTIREWTEMKSMAQEDTQRSGKTDHKRNYY